MEASILIYSSYVKEFKPCQFKGQAKFLLHLPCSLFVYGNSQASSSWLSRGAIEKATGLSWCFSLKTSHQRSFFDEKLNVFKGKNKRVRLPFEQHLWDYNLLTYLFNLYGTLLSMIGWTDHSHFN